MIARFTGVALNFAVAILITRQLSLGNAGVVFLLMIFVSGIALVSRVGLDQLIVKEVASAHEDHIDFKKAYLKNTHQLVLLISGLFVGIWLLMSPYVREAFFHGDIELSQLMWASVCVIFFNFMFVNSFYLKAIRHSSLSILTQNALPGICFLILIALTWNYFSNGGGHVVVYIISLSLTGFFSFFVVRPFIKNGSWSDGNAPKLKALFIKSLPLAPISFF